MVAFGLKVAIAEIFSSKSHFVPASDWQEALIAETGKTSGVFKEGDGT
jgi:hypothetical protein